MGVDVITPAEAASSAVRTLGLDPGSVDLSSPEVLATSLRRAASFLCPIPPGALVRAVNDALSGLAGYTDETQSELETTLNTIVAYGDLLELVVQDEARQRQLFLGPPAFVRRASGACLLLGVRADGTPLLSDGPMVRVEYEGHARRLPQGDPMAERLVEEGLLELQVDQWLRTPRSHSAVEHLAEYASRVSAVGESGVIEGVRVVDPGQPPTYYRGRWREPKKSDTGLFVARRPQGYGAELWCLLEVVSGEVRRGVDLPLGIEVSPGADDGWRLQAAMDSVNGTPQRFAVRRAAYAGTSVLDLFSPLPSWAQRRLDVIGTPIVRSRGALLSFTVPSAEVSEEIAFLEEMMWMTDRTTEGDF